MYEIQKLRASVEQILTAAAEEIFGVFKRSIAEIEEKLNDSSVYNERNPRLPDDVNQTECPTLVQKLWMVKEELEQQERNPSLDQVNPWPPLIKEEENLWTNQEGEQLQGLEEADITKFSSTPPLVKSEYDEDKAQTSQLHQSQTEENTEEPEDGDDYEGSEPDTIQNNDITISNVTCRTTHQYTEDDKTSVLETQMTDNTTQRPFNCSFCKKIFAQKSSLNKHMVVHTGERPFSCLICMKIFKQKGSLNKHMFLHTGEKPFSCSVCLKAFTRKSSLDKHMLIHTGERPFRCSLCKKGFTHNGNLKKHMLVHTGERPFSCSVCKKGFTQNSGLTAHMSVHTRERPFGCSVCAKGFANKERLKRHVKSHKKEDFHPLSL